MLTKVIANKRFIRCLRKHDAAEHQNNMKT